MPSYDNFGDNRNDNSVQINFTINYIMKLKPAYKIVELRESSNAYQSGLRVGDVLININGKQAYDFKLSEINRIFHGKTGKPIRLRIERNGQNMLFKFRLDDAFKIRTSLLFWTINHYTRSVSKFNLESIYVLKIYCVISWFIMVIF